MTVYVRNLQYIAIVNDLASTSSPTRAWLVRSGSTGAFDDWALHNNEVVIGFEVGDVSQCKSRDDVVALYTQALPAANPKAILNWAAQVWAFAGRIQEGDLVVLPLKGKGEIAIGRMAGPYKYVADAPEGRKHARAVTWLRTDVLRANLEQDLLYSLGAFMTVCEITRNAAASRLANAASTGVDPGVTAAALKATGEVASDGAIGNQPTDLIETARDVITTRVHSAFQGHDMEHLVAAILEADGYKCHTHGAGTDQGIDIVAGRGPLGLDAPRLLVQVKSSKEAVGSEVVQQLSGNIANHLGAEQGLLVAWGGLTKQARAVAQGQRFRIRVWTANDLIDSLLRVYPQLPDDLKQRLPLAQVWVLVDGAAQL
jgi:restriction system protein